MNNVLPILVAVLNSLWQAALVAALVWFAMKLLARKNRNINAATRHVIWWATLAVVLVLPVAPRMLGALRARAQPARAITAKPVRPPRLDTPEIVEPTVIVTLKEERLAKWPLWILAAWAALFLYRIGQIVRSYIYLRGVKRRSSISPQALPSLARPADLLLSGDVASPMAVGFLRPAVILPESLPEEIEGAELEHVLLHEAAHIARYDDWTNLAVRLLGAVLALHPVALWILRQIEREREMACDDWVVARTGSARPYAASLARMSELRWSRRKDFPGLKLASGLFGSGSNVGDRIETLLKRGRKFSPRVSPLRVGASTLVLLTFAFAGSLAPHWIAFAQQPARSEFEVASVKLNNSGRGGESVRQLKPGGLTYKNRALIEYIELAYGVQPYQVSHGQAVSLFERYDIDAKASNAAPEPQIKLMLRSLLEDRFKLAFHKESREISAYLLTVAKGGPHLKASEDEGPMGAFLKDGAFHYRRTSIGYLAGSVLSNLPSLGRPVVDRTGLDGVYDFSLRLFDPDAARGETDPKGDTLQQLDNGLSASLKDLGLRLESQKAAIEFLVIDHVEKPDAN